MTTVKDSRVFNKHIYKSTRLIAFLRNSILSLLNSLNWEGDLKLQYKWYGKAKNMFCSVVEENRTLPDPDIDEARPARQTRQRRRQRTKRGRQYRIVFKQRLANKLGENGAWGAVY